MRIKQFISKFWGTKEAEKRDTIQTSNKPTTISKPMPKNTLPKDNHQCQKPSKPTPPNKPHTKNNIVWDECHLQALNAIAQGENLFITGKAGTGKTTLLREIKRQYQKNKFIAVVAPTGVAAENADGFTMHSFFSLPIKPYLPEHKVCPELYKLDEKRAAIVNSIDILIIDEISMVRCDMLDATDKILRHYRKKDLPFGGIQLIMFGDVYQLCPVVTSEDENHLKGHYDAPYFFCSYALKEMKWKVIELKNVYRQKANEFISLLNRVRTAEIALSDLQLLDSRYEPNFQPGATDSIISLMTHTRKAKRWNARMFDSLQGSSHTYIGIRKGYFREQLPVPKELELKVGARVMFLRNDIVGKQYVNGTMGWVRKLKTDSVVVRKDNGEDVCVKHATWEQYDYYVDKATKTIYSHTSATYSQIPLKLAWAVSIHKSQGLTFDEVAIDARDAFASGQIYVALSRCRSIDGIHLLTKIPGQKITVDPIVQQFMHSIAPSGKVNLTIQKPTDQVEAKSLPINVRRAKYDSLENGTRMSYTFLIRDLECAKKIFKYEGNNICVIDMFKDIKKSWKYSDYNNGHCPFIVRRYKTVTFHCQQYGTYITAEISPIDVSAGQDTNGDFVWIAKFRIVRVIG